MTTEKSSDSPKPGRMIRLNLMVSPAARPEMSPLIVNLPEREQENIADSAATAASSLSILIKTWFGTYLIKIEKFHGT